MALHKVSILTLGCRVNQYESDTIASALAAAGAQIVPFGQKCDIAVINTCTVTAESDRKSRQMIRRAATFADRVAVTGCYAQISSSEAAEEKKVVFVGGNGAKASLPSIILDILEGRYTGEKNAVTPPIERASVETTIETPMRTRSYIKIEDGCENKCAYCIINKARGPVRSKSPALVIEEARSLSRETHELILTGIEAASYGMDFEDRRPYGHALADLIGEVAEIDSVYRIGLGSLDPTVMSDYFVSRAARCEKLLPHFHLSLQSGSSRVLASMRRKYNASQALAAIERMRCAVPDVTFSADVIVGFPGETDEDFAETVEFCRTVGFLHLHIFPYSKRRGTEAAEMADQIPENVKHERAARLGIVGEESRRALLADYVLSHGSAGEPVRVLVEKSRGGVISGHSEHFVEVKARGKAEIGEIVRVNLDGLDGKFCTGAATE